MRQLRRGTLGTGVKSTHSVGSVVYDQGRTKTIPYKDVTSAQTIVADGVNNEFDLNFTATTIDYFEVFVGGRRLRKNQISVFDNSIALDSADGDVIENAEVTLENTLDGSGNITSSKIVLRDVPSANQNILIVRKIGKTWTDLGVSLSETQNDIGYFLRSGNRL